MNNATESRVVHSDADASPRFIPSEPYTALRRAYRQAMKASEQINPLTCSQPVSVGDALISALRMPSLASAVLRPIADELEGRRARS